MKRQSKRFLRGTTVVNFDAISPEISALLDVLRSDTVLARARPDPDKAEPVSDEYEAVVTFGQFQIKPAARASLDYTTQFLQYTVYFDIWCKAFAGEYGLDRMVPSLHRVLQGQGIKGVGRLGFLDCAYEEAVPRAIALYSMEIVSTA